MRSKPGNQYIILCMGIDSATDRLVTHKTLTLQNLNYRFCQRLFTFSFLFRLLFSSLFLSVLSLSLQVCMKMSVATNKDFEKLAGTVRKSFFQINCGLLEMSDVLSDANICDTRARKNS